MGGKSINSILFIILIIMASLWFFIKPHKTAPVPSYTASLVFAEAAGIQNSKTMASLRKDLQNLQDSGKLDLIIRTGKLPPAVEGQATISVIGDVIEALVVIDTDNIAKVNDNIEPALGHEFKHVWDALFVYDKDPQKSVKRYSSLDQVGRKEEDYEDRKVEYSAILTEDVIRKELKNSGNIMYINMPKSREELDSRYKIKPNLTLKTVIDAFRE